MDSPAGAALPVPARTTSVPLDRIGPPAIVAAYMAGDESALRFFARNPFDPADRIAAAARAAGFVRDRETLVEILSDQNASWAMPRNEARGEVEAGLEALRDSGSVAVVTGQQPGLFGGPLFTVLKALTAVKLARRTAMETGRPCVPVFWIADEDHDFAEVHATALVRDGEVMRLEYADGRPTGDNRGPVGRLVLGEGIERTVADLENLSLPGPFASELVRGLRDAWKPGARWRDAFAQTIRLLLPSCPILLFSADDERAKRLASGVLTAEARSWPATHAAHALATEALEAAGYPPQVDPRPLHLFLLDEDRRLALDPSEPSVAESDIIVRATGRRIEAADLLRIAESSPVRLSPDVVTRPLVQDTLLPTAAYVAGPGEIAYFAQMAGVYEAFGVPMPAVAPRATMTLVEPPIRRAMDALGITADDLLAGAPAVSLSVDAPVVDAALTEAQTAVGDALAQVSAAVQKLDSSLDRAIQAANARMGRETARLRLKVERVIRRRHSDKLARMERVNAALRPDGKLQERVISAAGLYARYGPALEALVENAIDLDNRDHVILDLP